MALADWAPQPADVGAILRARTKDDQGHELGTWTADTRPTLVEVQPLLAEGQADVAAEVGEVPQVLWPTARRVAALGAALQVELAYFPEQVATGRSPYDQLKTLYDERLRRLTSQVGEVNSGDELGTHDEPGMPSYGFPDDNGGMVGWGTNW